MLLFSLPAFAFHSEAESNGGPAPISHGAQPVGRSFWKLGFASCKIQDMEHAASARVPPGDPASELLSLKAVSYKSFAVACLRDLGVWDFDSDLFSCTAKP